MTSPERPTELPPQYDPAAVESERYADWQRYGVFVGHAERSSRAGGDRTPFTIVIPPPNVTDILHVGHGLNNTVQDVIVRWRRMAGDEALWVPGTDHAGIATQNVVERLIAREENLTRFDVGREEFVKRTAEFVRRTGGTILDQLKAIGASCDWTRTAYTLSPEYSRAVREAFVRLYEDGLIYRGHRVIHWCPRCLTSLSDEEAEFADSAGSLYHIRYPVVGEPERALTIATTRPETLLGDVAVAVHPDDERYRDLVGRRVLLPLVDVEIPVIADEYVERAFGTGALKITPAHDANDFDVGRRHGLPMPVVISPEGLMREVSAAEGRVPPALVGMDRFEAREKIIATLADRGLLARVEAHPHAVRHCYRCDTVVEPRLSDQWFVKMAPLAEPALRAVKEGEIRILPERWEGVYVNWMENIRDWNISRQLWWGHRVPVWYCDGCGWTAALRADPAACPQCAGAVRQDEDVLDTWFSSWLWPIATLGWPEETEDLKAFYPTDVLVTAPEILFFWVARMIMSGYRFRGERPFHTVYLHGTVRDAQHRKMSKSLGNGIDPLDVVRLYGADALRWTSIAGMGLGADVILDNRDIEKAFAPGRNFVTKLWNIGRFILSNLGADPVVPVDEVPAARLTRADRWILDRLGVAVRECDDALGPPSPAALGDALRWTDAGRRAGLRLNEYAESARRFVWNELADWYVEAVKGRLATPGADRDAARAVLVHVFDAALRLLQPIVPLVTETLWQRLPGRGAPGESLGRAAWPAPRDASSPRGDEFELVREAVNRIRQIRADYGVPPGKPVDAHIVPAGENGAAAVFRDEADLIGRLARSAVSVAPAGAGGVAAHAVLADGTSLSVPLAGLVDVEKECARIRGELAQLEKQLTALEQRLANPGFTSRAPAQVVEGERAKLGEWAARREQLREKVGALCGT